MTTHNRSTYCNHGCRCDECKRANTAYMRQYLKKRIKDLEQELEMLEEMVRIADGEACTRTRDRVFHD